MLVEVIRHRVQREGRRYWICSDVLRCRHVVHRNRRAPATGGLRAAQRPAVGERVECPTCTLLALRGHPSPAAPRSVTDLHGLLALAETVRWLLIAHPFGAQAMEHRERLEQQMRSLGLMDGPKRYAGDPADD